MTKVLTMQNAQITTAAVEVKTLTISGKQVSQSVFRQLLNEQILNEDGSLAGVPWGHINYHPGSGPCLPGAESHLHVVWQKGAELRRALVGKPDPVTVPIYLPDELAEEWLEAAALDGWGPKGSRVSRLKVTFPSGTVSVYVSHEVQEVLWPIADYYRNRATASLKDQDRRSREELRDLVDQGIRAEVQIRQKLLNRWEELSALPHLFIAV